MAVWAAPHLFAPVANTVPFGSKSAGPVSNEATPCPPQLAAESHSCTGVVPATDQVMFNVLKSAAWVVTALASISCPLLNTALWASPIEFQPVGGFTLVQVLAT